MTNFEFYTQEEVLLADLLKTAVDCNSCFIKDFCLNKSLDLYNDIGCREVIREWLNQEYEW